MKNRPIQVRTQFVRNEGHLAISTATLGELVFGVERSSQPQANLSLLESMVARLDVLPFVEAAAHRFGQIRANLYRIGQPIGPLEMMIAGHARSRGMVLVTNNVAEFGRVAGLRVENWA